MYFHDFPSKAELGRFLWERRNICKTPQSRHLYEHLVMALDLIPDWPIPVALKGRISVPNGPQIEYRYLYVDEIPPTEFS